MTAMQLFFVFQNNSFSSSRSSTMHKYIYIEVSAHDAFLEESSSGTVKVKKTGKTDNLTGKPKDLNMTAKIGYGYIFLTYHRLCK